jgi:hypothetical protein
VATTGEHSWKAARLAATKAPRSAVQSCTGNRRAEAGGAAEPVGGVR